MQDSSLPSVAASSTHSLIFGARGHYLATGELYAESSAPQGGASHGLTPTGLLLLLFLMRQAVWNLMHLGRSCSGDCYAGPPAADGQDNLGFSRWADKIEDCCSTCSLLRFIAWQLVMSMQVPHPCPSVCQHWIVWPGLMRRIG